MSDLRDLDPSFDPDLDLVLDRTVEATPEKIWRCWTEPELLVQWFTPAPWQTVGCEIDLRPGGVFRTEMRGPAGESHTGAGCYLEVVPARRLVWTDALGPGYRPGAAPFMSAMLLLEPLTSRSTRYLAIARHRDAATREQHAQMGFVDGWSRALDQLLALALTLPG